MKRWEDFWDSLTPMFKFSADVRKVMYTTNAIESLNSAYRRLNSQRSVFPTVVSLQKALYLSTWEATKKWTMPLRNWGKVYGELSIMNEGRMPEWVVSQKYRHIKGLRSKLLQWTPWGRPWHAGIFMIYCSWAGRMPCPEKYKFYHRSLIYRKKFARQRYLCS